MTGIRVMVHDAWDEVRLPWDPTMSCARLKGAVLESARVVGDPAAFEVKVRGASVRDETQGLAAAGMVEGGAVIVLRRRRRAVR